MDTRYNHDEDVVTRYEAMNKIDPYSHYPTTHKVSVAMREISRKWFLCYSKLLSLEWYTTDDPSIPYGATDGRRLILNNSGIRNLVDRPTAVPEIMFLLCHEALHGLLGHPWRGKKLQNKQLANVAADYIINAMIDDRGMKLMPECLLDKALSGDKSMEQLYRELLNNPQNQKPCPMPDLIELTLEEGESEQEVVDAIEVSNESILIAEAIHAKATGVLATRIGDKGSVTGIRWQDVLWGYFTQHKQSSWTSPMNRPIYASSKLVCLGRAKKTQGTLAVVIDTSGSVSEKMLNDFLAEVADIREQVKPMETHVLSVSHVVCDYVVLDRSEIVPATLKGGGGTNFQPAFDYLAAIDVTPDVLIYLTDGYACDGTRLRDPKYPVLWVTTGATNMNCGEVIKV